MISYCQFTFRFQSVREQMIKLKINCLAKLSQCQNSFCSSSNCVANELLLLRTQLNAIFVFLGLSFCPLRSMFTLNHKYLFYILLPI